MDVGDFDGSAESKRVEFEFETEFDRKPVLILTVCAEDGKSWPDCYAATVIKANTKKFTANICRNKERGWGQNAKLYYLAVRSDNNTHMQCGRVEVGTAEEGGKKVDIKFDQAFPKGAQVAVVTTAHGKDYGDTFATTVRNIKRDRVSVQVNRVGENNGWGQELGMFWVATTMFPIQRFTIGDHNDGEVKVIKKHFTEK
mmetsp:Transcript_106616/g.229606  ORF Transcript_106616/g.229606 Transcript_106616/m.229606 type:complete len:199 (-) Transcript_106616:304-900(-)|eukprot:CAMPEP_0116934332 /NCGR_PEP_ID=MMETSP0467-20121206/29580_1 /TAXON_ID=283647 /ORGANISM="Mesodinium pulex, Strain SPMC105" /LENGTH=198 /DNA_ID=CAMNT_0004615405 /DNA_START=93 /DNA_END=689 /DNA_ORIENTATION=-